MVGSNSIFMGEAFSLPDGSTRCAGSSLTENQAFCIENHILALQFHPEVTASMINQFCIGHIHEMSHTNNLSLEQLKKDSDTYAKKRYKMLLTFLIVV